MKPMKICQNIKIDYVHTGLDHCMLVARDGRLWGFGDNAKGNLGTGDVSTRQQMTFINFFYNKRVIDVACGDQFTVVIAEVYDLDKDKETLYFKKRENLLMEAFVNRELLEERQMT